MPDKILLGKRVYNGRITFIPDSSCPIQMEIQESHKHWSCGMIIRNHGKPFAQVKGHSFRLTSKTIKGKIELEWGGYEGKYAAYNVYFIPE